MDPGLIGVLITVGTGTVGASVKGVWNRFRALRVEFEKRLAEQRAESDKRLAERQHKIDLLEKALDDKDATIAEVRSQRDRLQVTAELMDRVFSGLPQLRREIGDKHDA